VARAWRFENNVNTDEIIPGRYNITIVPSELAQNVFCELRPDFAPGVQSGDVVVAGKNFGCGSSREHAPIAIKGAGVECIVAESYARIFFRNAINIGLPILTCPDAGAIEDGDELDVDLEAALIHDRTTGRTYRAQPLPPFVLTIVEAGGIVPYLREHDIEELE
jgi:3-isopropylmalate/(R)-2-methylmalate dehydratase small subunit